MLREYNPTQEDIIWIRESYNSIEMHGLIITHIAVYRKHEHFRIVVERVNETAYIAGLTPLEIEREIRIVAKIATEAGLQFFDARPEKSN